MFYEDSKDLQMTEDNYQNVSSNTIIIYSVCKMSVDYSCPYLLQA